MKKLEATINFLGESGFGVGQTFNFDGQKFKHVATSSTAPKSSLATCTYTYDADENFIDQSGTQTTYQYTLSPTAGGSSYGRPVKTIHSTAEIANCPLPRSCRILGWMLPNCDPSGCLLQRELATNATRIWHRTAFPDKPWNPLAR